MCHHVSGACFKRHLGAVISLNSNGNRPCCSDSLWFSMRRLLQGCTWFPLCLPPFIMSPLSRYFGLIYTLIISRERSAASVADTVHPNIPSSSQAVKRGCNNFYPPVTCPRENVVYTIHFLHCPRNVGISWKKWGGLLIQLTRSLKFNIFYPSFQEPVSFSRSTWNVH